MSVSGHESIHFCYFERIETHFVQRDDATDKKKVGSIQVQTRIDLFCEYLKE